MDLVEPAAATAAKTQANYWTGVICRNCKQFEKATRYRYFERVVGLYPLAVWPGHLPLAGPDLPQPGQNTAARAPYNEGLLIRPSALASRSKPAMAYFIKY